MDKTTSYEGAENISILIIVDVSVSAGIRRVKAAPPFGAGELNSGSEFRHDLAAETKRHGLYFIVAECLQHAA
jgi:hypothetical protein